MSLSLQLLDGIVYACSNSSHSGLLTDKPTVTPIAKEVMFSLEPHVLFYDSARSRTPYQWGQMLGTDVAYLNTVVYAINTFFDVMAGKNSKTFAPSRQVYKHLSKALQLLRERLSDEDNPSRLSDSTVMIITTLAAHSSRLGQYKTAYGHLQGIRKIVEMRGGMAAFRENPKLILEILRYVVHPFLDE